MAQDTATSSNSGKIDETHESLLNEVQAAEILNISIRTLQAWRRLAAGPQFIRLSARAIRYRHSDVDEWLKARTALSTKDVLSIGAGTSGLPVL
ncbi:MAG: helix-turn-helix domain-containing protein [Alphaproteobacteria bacterium]|jgi:predicted DNA-binding transcriptional regulator AlpA|nr:helix-turn-helix domain-containing protein [Alphaproteobacteria bacterium]MBT4086753.1 helix-turn-helix domain-containing protein [Alphaproteobacteria bacterium]MBT4543527.1 helix-turn-helix domain-containing protein [Alphaproteobacteria bacterium]